MILRTTGESVLVRLMQLDRTGERDSEWLLFGPTDPEIVEPPEGLTRPSEPYASGPNTAPR